MSSGESPANLRKTYDDISFEKRKKLIYLIKQENWTIRAAAKQIGIKHCTAKQIYYRYKNEGVIYRKRIDKDDVAEGELSKIIYVMYPYYILCFCSPEQMPINLEHTQGN